MPFEIYIPKQEEQASATPEKQIQAAEEVAPQKGYLQRVSEDMLGQMLGPGALLFTEPKVRRQAARTSARALETVAGLPGDVVQLGGHLVNLGSTLLGGKANPQLGNIPYLPTSSKWRQYVTTPIAETLGGKGYLDPQNKAEAVADEVVGDLAAFMIPIKGKIPFVRALKTVGLGQFAKLGAQQLGLPEAWQEGLKAATMLGYNFAGPGKLKEGASEARAAAQSALPRGAEHSIKRLNPALEALSDLSRSGDLPVRWKDKVGFIMDQVAGGKIPVQSVWDLSQDINHAFYGEKAPAAFNRAFKGIKESIYDFMADYGKTNPEFYTNWVDSNSIFSALAKAEDLTSFIDKNLTKGKVGLATIGSLMGFYTPSTLAKYGGGLYIGKELAKTFTTLAKSPAARKYWAKTMGAAATGNAKHMNAYAGMLDKELSKAMGEKPKKSGYELVYPTP